MGLALFWSLARDMFLFDDAMSSSRSGAVGETSFIGKVVLNCDLFQKIKFYIKCLINNA